MQPKSPNSIPTTARRSDFDFLFEDTNTGDPATSDPYIYYRMYAEDGAIRSRSPVYSNDLYLARIWAKQVTLPRTLASLKRCLSAVECLDSPPITLFASAKCDVTLEDTDIVSLTHDTGTPPDPVILFLKGFQESPRSRRLDINKPEAVLLPARGGNTPFKAEFLYYRLYTEDGAFPSKSAVKSSDRSLGHINIITPPHTISSIKWCIAKAEGLGNGKSNLLFRNMGSQAPMDAAEVLVLSGGERLGLVEDPVVYVH